MIIKTNSCEYCKSEKVILELSRIDGQDAWNCKCDNCGATGPWSFIADMAVLLWNKNPRALEKLQLARSN